MLTDEEKREAIERAETILYGILYGHLSHYHSKIAAKILAKEAIVIECEVRHTSGWDGYQGPWTKFTHIVRALCGRISIKGEYQGKPGKAIAIIIPEEEE